MGYVDIAGVGHTLPDGRVLFQDVSFRVAETAKVALVGANGTGKTTLLRLVAGELKPQTGGIARAGGLGVMRQMPATRDSVTLGDVALRLSPPALCAAGERLASAERALRRAEARGRFSAEAQRTQLRYAEALTSWGESGGYDAEVRFDTVATLVLGRPWDQVRDRRLGTLSGGEQKRFGLELLLYGPDEVLVLDEPDNSLDVPAKRWLEQRLTASEKSILYVSHDRELLARTADRIVTLEGGTAWVHGAGFASWHDARAARHERLDELRRRWDEEHAKLKQLVVMYKQKAAYNSDMASRLQAAKTRLARFEQAGPPPLPPKSQDIRIRLTGGRTGKRAVICEQLEIEDLTYPFDLEVWYGDRVAVLGGNGTGKSHFLRLLGGLGGSGAVGVTADGQVLPPVPHQGVARLGARVVPGHFSQTHDRPDLAGRTLRDILWRGDEYRDGLDQSAAMKALNRYDLTGQSEQAFETLSGGQQARFLVLLLELSGATLLLLDEPTDNLDLASAEALEAGLADFQGTVIAVTHDRWFTRGFDRFVSFRGDGDVTETPEPSWQG
ncbi:MAG TPA: ATP-binding cassette domain-containing protein [Micromonosporaceae bacterium]|nr:ATP-binding cassette domain-containing protein [Micromonosporaceae bacterium]